MKNTDSTEGPDTQFFTFAASPDELKLDCGAALGPITVAYETYGKLNEQKDNAVLLVHALSGDAHAVCLPSSRDQRPGWWDIMIGPGKGIDTDVYFVICSNIIGGCKGSTGPLTTNPSTGKPYGLQFPVVTIADMVRVQQHLIDHLGIECLLAVIGGSMGGMQALKWPVLYPDRVKAVIPIATSSRLTPQGIAFNAVGRNAITSDEHWKEGDYYDSDIPLTGLSVARMIGHITYLSDKGMHKKFGRRLRGADKYHYDFKSEFEVETYLDYQGQKFVERFDANSYLYITKAMDYFDLPGRFGSIEKAFQQTQSRFLVVSYSSDWLFPPYQSREIVNALAQLGKDVSYSNIYSDYGHDAFLLDTTVLPRMIRGFLDQTRQIHDVDPQSGEGETVEVEPEIPSIYSGPRVDYDRIISLVEPSSKILDLGCGDGELLVRLRQKKDVRGIGIEISENLAVRCIERGIPAIQADLDEGLAFFADGEFDVAVLSQTLQVVNRPDLVLNEMLRVAKKGIISFPNFAYWRARIHLGLVGKAPVTPSLPYSWFDSPNVHFLSIRDFERICRKMGFQIEEKYPLNSRSDRSIHFFPNLFAEEAVYVISRQSGTA